ncbi:MAG: DUF1501 domain-containing protein [Isosphaeraceae bacterium]
MLSLFAARTAGRVSRRGFLRAASGLGAASLMTGDALARVTVPTGQATASRGIAIFLCGGPSQLDLWDPKPDAPAEIRGAFRPIETNVPGIWFTELIPRVARHADKLAVVRSMTHESPDHNVGIAHSLSGRRPSGPADVYVAPQDHPALGAILRRLRGEEGLLPPWVILPRPFTTSSPPYKGQSSGFLGPAFDPVMLDTPKVDSLAPKDLRFDAFALPEGVGAERFDARRNLLRAGDATPGLGRAGPRWDANFEKAASMLQSEACRRAFDLTREDPRLRDRYGRNEYGQSFLLARRLVEAGVRFVNVFWTYFDPKGCQFNLWDNHGVTTEVCGVGSARTGLEMIQHEYCAPSFDRAFSALLEDLSHRGLLDETLVTVSGEFGRTPRINATAGRDHWPNAYSQLLAGGGIRGGRVYGASDRHAAHVLDRPVRPEDFHATVLRAFGVGPDTFLQDTLGRPIRVTEGAPLRELFG